MHVSNQNGDDPQVIPGVQTPGGQADEMLNSLIRQFAIEDVKRLLIEPMIRRGHEEVLERINSNIGPEEAKFDNIDDALKTVDAARETAVFNGNVKKSLEDQGYGYDQNGNVIINGTQRQGGTQEPTAPTAPQTTETAPQSTQPVQSADPELEELRAAEKARLLDGTLNALPAGAKEHVISKATAMGISPYQYYKAHEEELRNFGTTTQGEKGDATVDNPGNTEPGLQEKAEGKINVQDDEIIPDPHAGWGIDPRSV